MYIWNGRDIFLCLPIFCYILVYLFFGHIFPVPKNRIPRCGIVGVVFGCTVDTYVLEWYVERGWCLMSLTASAIEAALCAWEFCLRFACMKPGEQAAVWGRCAPYRRPLALGAEARKHEGRGGGAHSLADPLDG